MFDSDLFPEESDILIDLVKRNPDTVYIELGVFQGGTFRKVLEKTNAFCIGIDLFEDFVINDKNTHVSGTIKKSDLEANLDSLGFGGRYQLIKGDTGKELTKLDVLGMPAVVFIDGNHTYIGCMRDFMAAYLFVIDKGYIVLHNASDTHEPDKTYIAKDGGPYKAVQELKKYEDMKYLGMFKRSAVFEVLDD